MTSKEILEKIKSLTNQEKRNISYDELIEIINKLTPNEIIELSNIIGYPVFTRLCMGVLKHKFVLLQDGAAAIIVNENGQILLQSRADNERWGLPGGCQELGERFEDTVIREIKEETNLDVDLNMDFVSKIKYKPSDLIIKDVYFYLATPKDNNAVAQDLHDQEVKDFEWCDYNEALFKITYDLDRDVIKKAHRYIKKHILVLK